MSMNQKSVVEDTLLQIKAVENAISENAKGILASTMKEEISELVRESLGGSKKRKLREQEEQDQEVGVEDEVEVDVEEPVVDDEMPVEPEMEEPAAEVETGDNQSAELPPLDMTQSPISDVVKVFRLMGDEDGIIVKKDDKGIHLSDQKNDTEYLIQMGDETENPEPMMENLYRKYNRRGLYEMDHNRDLEDGTIYELELNTEEEGGGIDLSKYIRPKMEQTGYSDEYGIGEDYDVEENVYEIDQESLESVLESFKAKGMGMGKPGNGFSKMTVNNKGFSEDKKSGGRGNTGKGPKFKYPKIKHGVTETDLEEYETNEWNEEANEELVDKLENKDGETKEASRTLGNGRKWGRNGLPKPRTAPRHLEVESVSKEMNLLREKNEEYKKALDFFRTKLNEVAVFNSNLAYSTRLFTEHSTTKQEKINILRRFDSVESLKESKNLYQSIKKELDGKDGQSIVTESIQRKVIKTPQSGSATNLIESKTYENPQFVRMKDLMTKIK